MGSFDEAGRCTTMCRAVTGERGPSLAAHALLVCHVRPARRKAATAATAEAISLLRDLGPIPLSGGPRAEQGGVFWLSMPVAAIPTALDRMCWFGYTNAVDLAEPCSFGVAGHATVRTTMWRRKPFSLTRIYEEDRAAARERAPDRRVFAYETSLGEVRQVRGYRGSGGALTRRGLPTCDARLLVNLVTTTPGAVFLDPFGGVGGIVLEAIGRGYRVLSCDVDPALRYGLSQLGAEHCIADASALPFESSSIDAIATEPPYHPAAESAVLGSIVEMHRVLRTGGRLSMLCADWQAANVREAAAFVGFVSCLDAPINRKGVGCVVFVWQKHG